jgi:hypothetical protein
MFEMQRHSLSAKAPNIRCGGGYRDKITDSALLTKGCTTEVGSVRYQNQSVDTEINEKAARITVSNSDGHIA